jgi:hypothetical protein
MTQENQHITKTDILNKGEKNSGSFKNKLILLLVGVLFAPVLLNLVPFFLNFLPDWVDSKYSVFLVLLIMFFLLKIAYSFLSREEDGKFIVHLLLFFIVVSLVGIGYCITGI